jgi:sigma-B regulation protein RsbU (phosphoserine phosphatase)
MLSPHPGTSTTARSALNLTSVLDVATRASEYDSAEPILNAALLSVMGRLKVLKACVLRPLDGRFETVITKGLAPASVMPFTCDEPMPAGQCPGAEQLVEAGVLWLVPLHSQGTISALMCLGTSLDELGDAESLLYLDVMRAIVAVAVHNAESMVELRKSRIAVERQALLLRSLFEVSRDFNGIVDDQAILRLTSLRLMGQLMTSSFAIILDPSFGMETVIVNRADAQHLSGLYPLALDLRTATRTEDLPESDPLRDLFVQHNVGMAAPMVLRGKSLGVLAVCRKLTGADFTKDECSFLESVASIVITALENERLDRDRRERERLENELDIAATIQSGLLPLELPSTPGLEIAASMTTSRRIGGDYYDVIPLDNERVLIAIADVAGKGVPAALLMANVQAALNVMAPLDLPLPLLMGRMNHLVCSNTEPDVFVTMFVGVINTAQRQISYVNAGHNPPLLVRDGHCEQLRTGGVLIGVLPDAPPYKEGVHDLLHNDTLLLYTDGVTEAIDTQRNEYGADRLCAWLVNHTSYSAASIVDALRSELTTYRASDTPDDDTSLLVIKVNE